MNLSNEVKNTALSDELFSKEKVKSYWISWDAEPWFSNPPYSSKMTFENGDFKGEKKFEAHSLKELFQKMDDFINSL